MDFGNVMIPKNLDFPRPQKIGGLKGIHAVQSDNIVIVDAQTLLIPNFSYDGVAPGESIIPTVAILLNANRFQMQNSGLGVGLSRLLLELKSPTKTAKKRRSNGMTGRRSC